MKQNLNEELSRMKTLMGGCCKSINEAEQSQCVNPESQQGLQMVTDVKNQLSDIGMTQSDIPETDDTSPEIKQHKEALYKIVSPVINSMDFKEQKNLVKGILQKVRLAKRNKTNTPTPSSVNEQSGSDLLGQISDYLGKLPTPVLIFVGAWLALRIFRCLIYNFESKLYGGCGLNIKKTFFVKLTELLLLDFKNLLNDDAWYHCGENKHTLFHIPGRDHYNDEW